MFIVQHKVFWETLETTCNYFNASKNTGIDQNKKNTESRMVGRFLPLKVHYFILFSKRHQALDHY